MAKKTCPTCKNTLGVLGSSPSGANSLYPCAASAKVGAVKDERFAMTVVLILFLVALAIGHCMREKL